MAVDSDTAGKAGEEGRCCKSLVSGEAAWVGFSSSFLMLLGSTGMTDLCTHTVFQEGGAGGISLISALSQSWVPHPMVYTHPPNPISGKGIE